MLAHCSAFWYSYSHAKNLIWLKQFKTKEKKIGIPMDKSKCFRSYLPISEVLVTDLAGDGRGHGYEVTVTYYLTIW